MTHEEMGFDPIKSMDFIRESLSALELPRKEIHVKAKPTVPWELPPQG